MRVLHCESRLGARGANLQGVHAGVNHLQSLHDGVQLLRHLRTEHVSGTLCRHQMRLMQQNTEVK
jgi:hypothetical protein